MAGDYSEDDKLLAIGIVERNGGQITKQAIGEIRQLLKAPKLNKSTIYRWWLARAERVAVATEMQPEKKEGHSNGVNGSLEAVRGGLQSEEMQQTLAAYYAHTIVNYLDRANDPNAIKETKGKDAITAAAIATDKMLLLLKLPMEVMQIMPDLIETIEDAGYPVVEFLQRVMGRLRDGE